MSTNWTKEQLAVIENRNSNLLVSAAAGSGKTAVLIERIIRLILDENNPIDINKLLVVTFTKAAASEMKERVRASIEKKLEENPENIHLQKQLILLSQAEITTIDSFCGHVLKNNFHLTDLPPNIKVGDPTEIQILSNEVMEDFFDYLYKERDEWFLKLVDWYSSRNNDRELINLLLNVNNFVNSSPNPKKWLLESADFFDNKNDEFYIENYFVEFSKDVRMTVISSLNKIKMVIKEVENYPELDNYRFGYLKSIDEIELVLYKLNHFIAIPNLENWNILNQGIVQFLEVKFESFRIPNKTDEIVKVFYDEVKGDLKKARDEIRNEISGLSFNLEDIKRENAIVFPYMKAISKILIEFRERFLEKKKSMGILDFADIEHYALDILRDYDENGNEIPSKVALEYQDLFEEVFIDEYQDSNYVQESILSLVSRNENPNRFMVGDVKQSIYRFRQAMPKIFMDKYYEYDLYTDVESKNKKIMLYNNFRSREEVLEACNLIFSKIMRENTGELNYTYEERLNPTAKFEDFDDNLNIGGSVEIHICEEKYEDDEIELDDEEVDEFEEIKSFRLECINIANIIKSSINQKEDKAFKVFDKKLGIYRNLEYRDIVILMRSPNKNATIFEEVFGECGIPIYTEGDSGYFNTFEIDTIVNLLKVIDNPIQDIPILSIMRSPIFNFNSREFSAIRLVNKENKFYDLLLEIVSDDFKIDEFCSEYELEIEFFHEIVSKTKKMLRDIEKFREKSNLIPIDEFIWYLLKETGYYDYVGQLEMGLQRQNNLMLLFERSRNYEKTSYKGLFNFVNYIERVKSKNADLGEAKIISEDANVVRLMSIHKSKGLEFPIVILANCDKKFNLKSGDTNLVLHQNLGFGPRIYDVEKAVSFDSLYKKKIERIQKKEQIAEEMRLLYVAMTRAKEKLIISARVKDFEKSAKKWESVSKDESGNISDLEVINSKSYLDWIMYVVSRFSNVEERINILGELSSYKKIEDSHWTFSIANRGEIFEKYSKYTKNLTLSNEVSEEVNFDFEFDNSILKRISDYSYPFKESINKPSSISVSEVKRIMLEDDEINYENIYSNKSISLKNPNFLHESEEVSFTSAEKGTIFHLVMQLLDFSKFNGLNDLDLKAEIKSQIDSLLDREILSPEEKKTVNISWILRFLNSDIFKEIFKANSVGKLYKEKVIYHNIKVSEIYKNSGVLDSERLMVVGIIDLFYEREDGIVLLDYKTDYIDKDNFESVVSRYNIQLELYKNAIEDISGKKVIKKCIYFMRTGELVEY